MKCLLVCLMLAAASQLGHGEEYTISAKRTSQDVPNIPSYMYIALSLRAQQDVTFNQNVTEDDDFQIEGDVKNEGSDFSYATSDPPLQACSNMDDDSWDYVLVSLIAKTLFPGGKCPVPQGTYKIVQDVDPITVKFPNKIDCGDYEATLDLYKNDNWFVTFVYTFTIDDDDNCNSN